MFEKQFDEVGGIDLNFHFKVKAGIKYAVTPSLLPS